jgi:xylulokinase
MRLLLGIDLGTTGLKATVFDLDGSPLGRGFAANRYLDGPPGWAEQDPRDWWAGCCQAVGTALAQCGVDPAHVAGVAVCGFHHCPVFLNDQGDPTRPSIVTHDSRLGASLADLERSGVLEDVVRTSGSQVVTGHFPPIYHHVWNHDRQALDDTRWILLAKDYLRYKLTGKIGTEICDATGTHLVAMPDQDWSATLCELLRVPREKLPAIGASRQVCGEVTPEAAQATGLQAGTPVVCGGGDSHCAMVGLGVTGEAQAALLLGTNSTLRASFGGFIQRPEASVWIQQHVVPDRYTVSASSMAGSSALSWFKELCFDPSHAQDEADLYRQIDSLAAGIEPGCDGLLFHPYLYGERSPFYNPAARGSFLAIAHWHGRGHFVRSVMEGISLAIANCLEPVRAIAGSRGESIGAIRTGQSGGSRLSSWRQILADVLELPLEIVVAEEPGCWGAAVLAGVGVGAYDDIDSAVERSLQIAAVIDPKPSNSALYRQQRDLYNRSYTALEAILYPKPTD